MLERLAAHGQFNYVIDCRGLAQEIWFGAERVLADALPVSPEEY